MNRIIGRGATLLLFAASAVVLGACGSGAVSAPPTPDSAAGTPLAVSPPTVDLFPDLPTTFTITGGRSGYTATSSNSAVLPVTTAVVGSTFTVVPSAVPGDTAIDITVRDALNASATAKATVKPSALNSQVTFTPLNPVGSGCGTGLCSGSDAQVVVKAVLNGVVLRSRAIRFDVYQGTFQLVTPGTGALVSALTVSTDEQGDAVVRILANAAVPTQVATLQSTDVTSGLARRFNFNIVQATSGLSTLPSGAIAIKGAKGAVGQDGSCPIGARVDFYIFGGLPPYSIGSPLPGVLTPITTSVATSGGSFGVQVSGCGKASMIVTDSKGLAIETASIDAQQGDSGSSASTASLAVTPSPLPLGCGQTATVSLTGSGNYTATKPSLDPALFSLTPSAGAIPGSITFTRSNSGSVSGNVFGSSTEIVVNISSGAISRPLSVLLTGGSSTVSGIHTCP
jgi:hypothetical protein